MAVPTTELWNNKRPRKILIQTHQYSAKIYHSSRFDSKKTFFQEIRKRFFFQILAAQARYVRIWTLRSWVTLFCTPQPTTRLTTSDANELLNAGAHQMEPPSPIQALGVNPFPSRFIIRTVPRGDSRADGGKSQSQRRNDTAIVLHQTTGNSVLTGLTQS